MLRRSYIRNKTPMTSSVKAEPKEGKERQCAAPNCEATFIKKRMEHVVCSPRCLIAKRKADEKAERENFKERKEAVKTRRDLRPLAQKAFNEWVRARDAHLPCVSCGETNPPMKPGGQWDAGHFLGRGAYPELAFNEDNCHKQCKSCNGGGGKFKHKERTVNQKYRVELLERIGPERLAALEGPHPPAKLDEDAYRSIAATYRAKLKQLKEEA